MCTNLITVFCSSVFLPVMVELVCLIHCNTWPTLRSIFGLSHLCNMSQWVGRIQLWNLNLCSPRDFVTDKHFLSIKQGWGLKSSSVSRFSCFFLAPKTGSSFSRLACNMAQTLPILMHAMHNIKPPISCFLVIRLQNEVFGGILESACWTCCLSGYDVLVAQITSTFLKIFQW